MRSLVNVLLVASFVVLSLGARAYADWPERPVRIIVPYTAGSMGDTVTRLLSESLQSQLGQPFVVDNRPGAGGNIGSRAVELSPPDGYTLLIVATNNLVINQFLYQDLGFDPLKKFDFITVLADVPSVVFINGKIPASTFGEFVKYAQAHRGKLNYASPGSGTTPHLSAEAINKQFNLEMTHVPYRGASMALGALLAGDVQLYLAGAGVGEAQVAQGQLKALAVSSAHRLDVLPQTPTFDEVGIGNIHASNWWGIVAPVGTPQPILARLHDALCKALSSPRVKGNLDHLGDVPVCNTSDEMAKQVQIEADYWQKALKGMNIHVQ